MSYLNQTSLEAVGFKKIGVNVRISDKVSIYNPELIEIGDHTRIDDFCIISGNVMLGKNVHIAPYCNISGGTEGIIVEDFSGFSARCHVFTRSDDYSGKTLTNPTITDKYRNVLKLPIHIKRHSIVGTGSTIFPGVVLEEGTSVGAMSLVTKSTQAWSVYFGIPATRLKARSKELLQLETSYLAEELTVT